MLLTEFDPERKAVINPDLIHTPVPGFPETVISIFSHTLFEKIVDFLAGEIIAETKDVDGIWPVYQVEYKRKQARYLCLSFEPIPSRSS